MNVIGQILHLLITPGLWHTALEASIVLLLAALGGVISERSGVVNIAMEGMMLTGAFTAAVVSLYWPNPWLATIIAIIMGGLMALIHAVVSIRFKADQIISGVAINIFAFGMTAFLNSKITNFQGFAPVRASAQLPQMSIPLLEKIPFFGPALFHNQNVVVYLGLLILVGVQVVLFRTRLGLRIRAVGEHPQAADTAGINVYALRYGAVVTSGMLSGLAGAFLLLGIALTYNDGMTSGRGYIALAAMIFGKWKPFGAFAACLIFGLGYSIVANNSTLNVSRELLGMLPYLLTLVVLAGLVGKSTPPAADGVPYTPGVE